MTISQDGMESLRWRTPGELLVGLGKSEAGFPEASQMRIGCANELSLLAPSTEPKTILSTRDRSKGGTEWRVETFSHVTLGVNDLDEAIEFFDAVMAALGQKRFGQGDSWAGIDEGKPGLRPENHADFYASYVRDLDGNKLLAVCHRSVDRASEIMPLPPDR